MTSLKQFICEFATTCYDDDKYGRFNARSPSINDITRLGGGCSRSVYQFEFEGKTIAIKFALNQDCKAQNRREWKLYHMLPKNVQDMMAKPLAISTCGRLIAFEFIPETIARSDKYAGNYLHVLDTFNSELRIQLESFFDNPKQTRWVMTDNHANNIGVKENGDKVWIDYAIEWWE